MSQLKIFYQRCIFLHLSWDLKWLLKFKMENPHNLFGNIPKPLLLYSKHGNFEAKLITVLIALRIFINSFFTHIFIDIFKVGHGGIETPLNEMRLKCRLIKCCQTAHTIISSWVICKWVQGKVLPPSLSPLLFEFCIAAD